MCVRKEPQREADSLPGAAGYDHESVPAGALISGKIYPTRERAAVASTAREVANEAFAEGKTKVDRRREQGRTRNFQNIQRRTTRI